MQQQGTSYAGDVSNAAADSRARPAGSGPPTPPLPQQQPYQWVSPHQQQQQWMAMMQYPATAMAMMQQQQMMYHHHYMPYGGAGGHHPYYQNGGAVAEQRQHGMSDGKLNGCNDVNGNGDETQTIWIGDLFHWMDETYLHSCFAQTGQVLNVKLIRNKQTGQSEGYGFVEFYSHAAAEKVLQSYSGVLMPNTEQPFRLNWATFSGGEKRTEPGSDPSVFVGDLAPDVTDSMLQETFSTKYPSVKGAKVIMDSNTGRSKGYGFVRFGDENERLRAMTEMNGEYCSSRPMRIDVATPKRDSGSQQQYSSRAVMLAGGPGSNGARAQGFRSDGESNNTTIFVGMLDSDVSDEDLREPFSQFGEILSVKIPVGKGCGFLRFSNRKDAEVALQNLQGTVIGKQTVRLSWGRNKQQWRGDHSNQWNGANYGGQGYSGNGYAVPPNQDPNMYAPTAVPGAS